MITCDVLGPSKIDGYYLAGLGNQIFTVATTLALAIDNEDEAIFPDLHDRDWYGSYVDNIFRNLKIGKNKSFIQSTYREINWKYNEIPYSKNLCLVGYFQSEKYFKHRRKEILQTFSIPDDIYKHIFLKYSDILTMKNTVAVHVRRNDILTPSLSPYHYAQKTEYYERAMAKFSKNSTFVFFSDDIQWCKENFKKDNTIFIEGEKDIVDLYFMSMLEDNIIANSSFSWWAAWLNQNPHKRVSVPNRWYGPKNAHLEDNDIVPDDWEVV